MWESFPFSLIHSCMHAFCISVWAYGFLFDPTDCNPLLFVLILELLLIGRTFQQVLLSISHVSFIQWACLYLWHKIFQAQLLLFLPRPGSSHFCKKPCIFLIEDDIHKPRLEHTLCSLLTGPSQWTNLGNKCMVCICVYMCIYLQTYICISLCVYVIKPWVYMDTSNYSQYLRFFLALIFPCL